MKCFWRGACLLYFYLAGDDRSDQCFFTGLRIDLKLSTDCHSPLERTHQAKVALQGQVAQTSRNDEPPTVIFNFEDGFFLVGS